MRGWPEPRGSLAGAEGTLCAGATYGYWDLLLPSPRPWAQGLGQCDFGEDEGWPSPLARLLTGLHDRNCSKSEPRNQATLTLGR